MSLKLKQALMFFLK